METTVEFPPTPPAPGQTVQAGISLTQEAPVDNIPKIPVPITETAPVVAPSEIAAPPTPDLPFSTQPNGDHISDVQRVALNGILNMRNIEYESLAQEAFEAKGMSKDIPIKEDLSYEDAVVIIKFGNDKYRKGNH